MVYAELKKRIEAKKVNIAVIGLGYVGLPLAVEFAQRGFSVLGVDTDSQRIDKIRRSIPYILDVDIARVKKVMRAGRFCPSGDFSGLSQADVVIICVPTPLKRGQQPNISYIVNAVGKISRYLRPGQLVILESTTYPGTTEEVILPLLEKSGLSCGRDFYLAFSPERIDPGNPKYSFRNIPKVVGGITPRAAKLVQALYSKVIVRVVPVSSARVAETVKLLENTFRLINIGLVNELAMMSKKMGIDIWEVIRAASSKPFGFMPFYPGPGVGGHCIPKDPLYLYWKARHYGFRPQFIKLASKINSAMPDYVVGCLRDILSQKGIALSRARVLVLGATYKKDVKDLRKSPALEIMSLLSKQVKHIAYSDPLIPYLKFAGLNLKSRRISRKALAGFDCVILATDHSAFDYRLIAGYAKAVLDTRNVFYGNRAKNIFRL